MFKTWREWLCLFLWAISHQLMGFQANPDSQRPKIGLALSGGGARGLAHVGVLKALEAEGITIDYIAGTSMGSIVGGLYAMGYDPDSIERFFMEVDWTSLLNDDPPRREMGYRRKQEDSLLSLDLEMGIKNNRIYFPGSLSAGNQLKLLMRVLSLNLADRLQFSDLGISFAAVATNLENGSMVVLQDGDFVEAIRASMALPGIFSPVLIGDKLLCDGGMVRNLPVDVVRDMGADIVIAVDLSRPLLERDKLNSLVSISNQALNLFTALNVQKSLAEADIVLNPNLGEIDLLDFRDVRNLVELGKASTIDQRGLLEKLPRTNRDVTNRKIEHSLSQFRFKLGFISFSGLEKIEAKRVLQLLELKSNQDVTYDILRNTMFQLAGMEEFDLIDFYFQKEGDLLNLMIQVRERPIGPHYLRFGFQLYSNESRGLELNLLASQTTHPLNRRGGEWRNQISIGRSYGFRSEYFQPLDLGENLFFTTEMLLQRDTFNIFDQEQRIGEGESRVAKASLALGLQIKNWGELRLGLSRGVLDARLRTGDLESIREVYPEEDILDRNSDTGGYAGSLRLDRLDNPFLPHQGFIFDLDAFASRENLGGPFDYNRLEMRYLQFGKRGNNIWMGGFDFGTGFGKTLPLYDQFFGGGTEDFSGLLNGEIAGSYKGIIRLGYFRAFSSLKRRSEIGGWVDIGNYWQNRDDVNLSEPLYGTSLFYGKETFAGPIYLGVGLTEGGRGQFFLAFGQIFR